MDSATHRRLQRIFAPDGRALIVAMDHAIDLPVPGLDRPGNTITQVLTAGADTILTTPGVATRYAHALGRGGLILRMDGGVTHLGDETALRSRWLTVEDALAIGADGVACMALPGSPHEAQSLPYAAQLVAQAHRWGVPVMIEALPRSVHDPDKNPDRVAFAARLGAELGADLIKTVYTGSVESFARVVQQCYVPIVVLGGVQMSVIDQLVRLVADALAAGAAGVAVGRNIWQHADPARMARALALLIHQGGSADDAIRLLHAE